VPGSPVLRSLLHAPGGRELCRRNLAVEPQHAAEGLLQVLKKLRPRFKNKRIKIMKLFILNTGYFYKKRATCLKLGDFLHHGFRLM